MRVPGFVGTQLMRVGVAVLALSIVGTNFADAASKKKRTSGSRPAAHRVVAKSKPRVPRAPVVSAAATGWQTGYADIIVDANTGRVLHEQNADALRHPASLTKVMTLYLLFEQLEAGKLRLDSRLPVSANAARQPPTKLGLKAGSTIAVEDAIEGLVTRSANDAAMAIGEAVGGDSDSFAALMTRRARQLGMSRTTFRNPNGLPNKEQVTTARDLAVLGRAIQERFPRYYGYFSIRSFNYNGVAIRNHNRMFGRLEGVDGIKTGYTNASGFNLLTSVKSNGRYVIGVVLGGASAGTRDTRMVQLINGSFDEAYAGRQQVARMSSPPSGRDDVGEVAVAQAPVAPLIPPAVASTPAVIPVPAGRPALAMASAVSGPAPAADEVDEETAEAAGQSDEPATTGALPPQHIAMVAPAQPEPAPAIAHPVPLPMPAPAVGSAAPIVPTTVRTVAVAKPAAPVAGLSNQPGILGTLAFTQGGPSVARSLPPQLAQAPRPTPTAKPVRLASADPNDIPRQVAETAERSAAPRAGWAIQIGAYGSESDARTQLAKAKARAGSALAKVDPYTEQATKGSSTIVRARFAGFDEQAQAQKACKALKGQFGCMVFRN